MVAKGDPWSDEELEATVIQYVDMRDKLRRGGQVTKTHVYRALNAQFAEDQDGRGQNAYERRMMNISHVYSLLGLPWIPGLPPARKIGEAAARIEEMVTRFEMLEVPTVVEFEEEVSQPSATE